MDPEELMRDQECDVPGGVVGDRLASKRSQ